MSRNNHPASANILRGRFILTIKDEGSKNEIWKAQFDAHGHENYMKSSIVHNTAVAREFSTKVFISTASIKFFSFFHGCQSSLFFNAKRIFNIVFMSNFANNLEKIKNY